MKIDTAAASFKNGTSEQMIQIYHHGGQKENIDGNPVPSEKHKGQQGRKGEVQGIMNYSLQEHWVFQFNFDVAILRQLFLE